MRKWYQNRRVESKDVNDLTFALWNIKAQSFHAKQKAYHLYVQEESGENLIGKIVCSAGEKFKQVEIFLLLWFAAVSLFSHVEGEKKENFLFYL